jgi:hypothetical protein
MFTLSRWTIFEKVFTVSQGHPDTKIQRNYQIKAVLQKEGFHGHQ